MLPLIPSLYNFNNINFLEILSKAFPKSIKATYIFAVFVTIEVDQVECRGGNNPLERFKAKICHFEYSTVDT